MDTQIDSDIVLMYSSEPEKIYFMLEGKKYTVELIDNSFYLNGVNTPCNKIRKLLKTKIILLNNTGVNSIYQKLENDINLQYHKKYIDNYDLFQKLWDDKVNYGPIIASCCITGFISDFIPMQALMSTWTRLKKHILREKTSFIDMYRKIISKQQFNYSYQNKKYNFLVDFYERGLCNCECGTFLCFTINQLIPIQAKVFIGMLPNHIGILIYDKISEKYYKENNELVLFETTSGGEMILEKVDNIEFIITSPEILAFNIIFYSAILRNMINVEQYKRIFEYMFGVWPITKIGESCKDIFIKMKKPVLKNFLDIMAFCHIIIFFLTLVNSDIIIAVSFIESKDYVVMYKKYLKIDLDDFINNKNQPKFFLDNRTEKYINQISNIFPYFSNPRTSNIIPI